MKVKKGPVEQKAGKDLEKLKEDFVDSFFDSGSGLVWIANENLDLVYTNENFNQYFSLHQHSCINFSHKVSEEIINLFHCYHQEVLKTGKRISTETSTTTADGQEIVFYVEIFPFEEKMVGGYAIKLATDHKRKELEKNNQRLLKLAEERLQKQREIAENVIKILERERTLIGYELHDNINQILAVVRLYIGMFKPPDKDQKELKNKSLEQINEAIEEV